MKRFIAALALATSLADADPALAKDDPIGDIANAAIQRSERAYDWLLKATLYHAGAYGVGNRDAKGCTPIGMRTAAVDRKQIPLGTKLWIKETVGLRMPDGSRHDGFWYASDTGGKILGNRIDLYTGNGRASMAAIMKLNLATLTVQRAGTFKGCPK